MIRKRIKTFLLLGVLSLNYLMNHITLDVFLNKSSRGKFEIYLMNKHVSLVYYHTDKADETLCSEQNENLTRVFFLWTLNQLEAQLNKID